MLPGKAAWLRFARRPSLSAQVAGAVEDPGVESGTATFSTLRQGYTYNVRAFPLDQEGNTALGIAPILSGPQAHTTLVSAGPSDPLLFQIVARSPGTDSVTFDVANFFTEAVVAVQPLVVLDATRIEFKGFDQAVGLRLPTPVTEGDFTPPEALVTAIPRDAREADGTPTYSLSAITWTRAGTKVQFATTPLAPVAANSVADTLAVYVRGVEAGDDTVTVTATNSLGQQITGSFTVRVLAATTVALRIQPASAK